MTVALPETRPVETTAPVKTTADVLRAAAWYIEEHGWCRATFTSDDGRVCAWGAINAVVNGDPENDDEDGTDAYGALGKAVGDRNIPDWNDRRHKAAEVVAALRAAAELAS
jgi:hypothetical protein